MCKSIELAKDGNAYSRFPGHCRSHRARVRRCLAGAVVALAISTSSVFACYAVVVGKGASADGSVLVGHNEQNGGTRLLNFRKIPRVSFARKGGKAQRRARRRNKALRPTRRKDKAQRPAGRKDEAQRPAGRKGEKRRSDRNSAFFWSENPGLYYSDGYLNEWGVAVVSDGCRDREVPLDELRSQGELTEDGISYMLRRRVAERARTARQGVRIAGSLIATAGYPASRTLVIADPNEAWLLSMSRGKNWIAQRVPDDQVVLLPNVYVIDKVDLEDRANFMSSRGLIGNATRRGWFDPKSGKPFRFREAYDRPRSPLMDLRQWRGQCLVTGKAVGKTPDRQLPFSVTPARRMSVKDVIEILRYHGEGGLCSAETQEGAVFQLRSRMSSGIGCIYWRTTGEPCAGVLTPWYVGIEQTPKVYHRDVPLRKALTRAHHLAKNPEKFEPDPTKAWWIFKKLQDMVNADRKRRLPIVRKVWDDFEAGLFARQAGIEEQARQAGERDGKVATAYLTNYSCRVALDAVETALDLVKRFQKE